MKLYEHGHLKRKPLKSLFPWYLWTPFSDFASVTIVDDQRIAGRRPSGARAILRPGRKQNQKTMTTKYQEIIDFLASHPIFPCFCFRQRMFSFTTTTHKFFNFVIYNKYSFLNTPHYFTPHYILLKVVNPLKWSDTLLTIYLYFHFFLLFRTMFVISF